MTGPRVEPVTEDPLDALKALKPRQAPSGQLVPGNIDLTNRPHVKNADGSVSTVRSMSFNQDGKEILVPTVSDDGRIMSNDEAVANYQKTGKHLGIFRDPQSATSFAQQLHERQAKTLDEPDPLAALKALRTAAPAAPPAPTGLKSLPPAKSKTPIRDAIMNGAGAIAAHGLSALQVIPGAEEAEAALGVPISYLPGMKHMSYAESLANMRSQTDKINPYVKTAEQTAASLPMLGAEAITKLAPAAAGALFGGLHGATKADPGLSTSDVVKNTAVGTGVGALLGKVADVGVTGFRALKAKTLGATALSRDAARSQAASNNYGDAIGNANPPTPAVQAVINNQDFDPLAAKLEQSPSFRGMARTDPQFLHEIYKGLSDESAALDKKLIPPDPSKGNSARRQVGDIRLLKNQLLDALETPGSVTTPERTVVTPVPPLSTAQSPRPTLRDAINDFHARPAIAFARKDGTVAQQMAREALERHAAENVVAPPLRGNPGPRENTTTIPASTTQYDAMMPGYRPAVDDYAAQSRDIDAFNKSADATQRAITQPDIAGKNLTKKSPEAFAQFASRLSPSEAQAGTEGALGRLKDHLSFSANPFKGFGIPQVAGSVSRTAPLVRQLDQQSGNTLPDLLAKLGIVSTTSALK